MRGVSKTITLRGCLVLSLFILTSTIMQNMVLSQVTAKYAIDITGFRPVNPKAITGETATTTVTVKNIGESPVTGLRLIINAPLMLSNIVVKPVEVSVLDPRTSVNFLVEVSIPSETITGDYILTIQAVSEEAQTEVEEIAFSVLPLIQRTEIRCPEYWQVASPGAEVTFELIATNIGSRHESYFLYTTGLPEKWNAGFYAGAKKVKAIELDANNSVSLVYKVNIPEDAKAGDYWLRVYAKGNYSSTSYALSITVEKPSRLIDITSPYESQRALTGESFSYPIRVVNNGDQSERIFLSVNVTEKMMDWHFSFTDEGKTISNLVLEAGEGRWVLLDAAPPYLVSSGENQMIIVATTEDGQLKATLSLTAVITAKYGIEIAGFQPINPESIGGEKSTITVTVRNVGESPVTGLRLVITAPATLSNVVVTPIDVLVLDPKTTVNFLIRVSVPFEAATGDYIFTVQAVGKEALTEPRELVFSVATAIPWFWINIGITVTATAVAVIAIERTVSRFRVTVRKTRRT